ncbi:type VII secretion target [Mycobacterium kyorinense]|uniref:type VII secretion target n=1 Tax=Mycobacterium kyorinense TaxID=487514 RepID=UPI0009EE0E37|nr:type VII secretion target [Mycobacterium kyorinense]
MAQEPLSVDPERLAAAAQRLLAAAEAIPQPPAPYTSTGTDPLSAAIAAQASKVEAPVAEGLPALQKEASESAHNVASAASAYERTDRQLGVEINKRTFPGPDRSENKHNGRVQLVDWKQGPTPAPSPGHTGQDARNAIKGLPKGTKPNFLEIRSGEDLRSFWNWLTQGVPDSTGTGYPGTQRVLSDGTIVGIRESEKFGPTMEIRSPNKDYFKVHVNPARGGVPNIPSGGAGPSSGGAALGPSAPSGSPPAGRAPIELQPGQVPARGGGGAMPYDPNEWLVPGPHPVPTPHTHHGPPRLGETPSEIFEDEP